LVVAELSMLTPATAAPPPAEGDTRSGSGQGGGQTSVGIGGFTAPPGGRYDPLTSADPGLPDRPRDDVQDKTYGATGQGDRLGYDIIDASSYANTTGWSSEAVPDYHVVQAGDSLSGICAYYYGDMYLWPKVWSYNPHITNAHWIFPGDRIRLTDPYESVSGP